MSKLETEVTRVLQNPDHVILSEALKDALGTEEEDTNFENLVVKVQNSEFSVSGKLINFEVFDSSAEVSFSVPIFKALSSVFNLRGDDVEISFHNFSETLKGKVKSVAVNTKDQENPLTVNLRFYLKFPK